MNVPPPTPENRPAWRTLLGLVAAVSLATLASAQPTQLYHNKTNLVSPNSLLTVDIAHTAAPELVVTDVKGKIRLYDLATGMEMNAREFGSDALTSPVVGDFLRRGDLDIAFGTSTGEVLILEGSTLNPLVQGNIGNALYLQPTVVTHQWSDGTFYDRLIFAGEDGRVRSVEHRNGELAVVWEYSTGSSVQSPIIQGNVRGPNTRDLVMATRDGHVILVNPETGEGEKVLIQEGAQLPVSPLLADVTRNGLDEVILTLGNGEVRCLRWDNTARPKLQEVWKAPIPSAPVAPPILITSGGLNTTQRIVQASEASLQVLDAATGRMLAQDRNMLSGINTQPAVIPRLNDYPELAFGLKQTMQITLNLGEWISSEGSKPLRTFEGELRHNLTHGIVTGAEAYGSPVLVVGMSPEGNGHLYAFNSSYILSETLWPTLTPWSSLGGSPRHNSLLDRQWAQLEASRRAERLARGAAWRTELDTAVQEERWVDASELAAKLVRFDPYNPDFQKLRWEIWRKKNFVQIVVVVLLVIGIGGFSIWRITDWYTKRMLRRRGEAAVARGDYDEARRYYERLHAKSPRNGKVAYALAKVCIAQREYSEECLAIYRKAYAFNNSDQELLHSYTRALLLEPKTNSEAAEVYKAALPSFPEPQLLEYGLGRCHLAHGEYEEAGRRLRSALRGGIATDSLYAALSEVYLKTKNYSAKALPVYQQQYQVQRENRAFLEAYLLSCVDAKKMDAQVESLCQDVLESSPGFVPAYLHLARILMQKNQAGAAIEEIRQAIERDPNNADAATLLATCYRSQNRKDPEALKAYLRALEFETTDAEMLRTVAGIYFEREQFDAEATSIYRRSIEQNPQDPSTLKALAQTAQLTVDHDLAIRSIESLAEIGTLQPRHIQQLAAAYIRRGIFEPRTEKTFREALRLEPGNPEYVAALARVYTLQDRDEAECLPIYEEHLRAHRDDIAVGRQLAKTFIKLNRFEQALATAQQFLKLAPEDEELQRLNALASLYGNKLDEAVSEYRRILEKNPDDGQALVNLALAYGQKLRTDDEAEAYYQRALELKPDEDMLHLAMARAKAWRNDAAASVDHYKSALKVGDSNEQKVIAHIIALLTERPEILRVRWFLVELLVSYGHLREALEQIEFIGKNHPGQTANILRALESILKKDPRNITALYQMGALLLAEDKIEEAIATLEKVHQLQPTSPEIQDRLINAYRGKLDKKEDPETRYKLGRMYYNQQEYDQAIGNFQKTAQDYRWEADSTKMLGKCFTGKGMLDLALQEYKKLVVDDETKELLYDLAQRYENKRDLVGAKTVYRQLFAADIDYKDVKSRFELLSGSTSDPMAFEKTSIVQQMSEEAARRYELLDELGRGAMGIVYRARDKELEEIVALKILPDNMSNNPEAVRRFKIEARNARKLSHPNIVRIHDIGEEMGRKYISMEYVDGPDLKKKIKSNPDNKLPQEDAIRYAMAIADALGYAHRLGIVHRDIKPANIMLTSSGEVKVTDFGIAKMMDSTGEGTMIGAVIGTPLYMSPEQVQGIPVDNRADVYSFGIMLYEMFSGRPPFTDGDLAYQHIHRDPDPIPGLHPMLWEIVSRCLKKKKEDRFDKAEDTYEAFREFKRQA